MKRIILAAVTLVLLSACATNSEPIKPQKILQLRIEYFHARDDLKVGKQRDLREDSTTPVSSLITRGGERQIFYPNLSYAIFCNQEKSICKHAVVKANVEYQLSIVNDKEIHVRGQLKSEMGRSKTREVPGSSNTTSVPEGVEIIGTQDTIVPFEKNIKIDERFELVGLAEDRIFFSLGYGD